MARFEIFISSPGDVSKEREIVEKVVQNDINTGDFASRNGIQCKTFRWEIDAFPLIFGSPQNAVDMQSPEYQIYVGIMWKRFDTKTENADSGTEDEFKKAFENHSQSGIPLLMFYFCDRYISPRELASKENSEQLKKVNQFKSLCESYGIPKTYKTKRDFKNMVGPDIEKAIRTLLKKNEHKPGKEKLDSKKFLGKFKNAFQEDIEIYKKENKTYPKYIEL